MAWRSSGATNAELVDNLCRHDMITDARVRAAFLAVDRAHYAPRAPYQDAPQGIGHRATISAPHMHAIAVEHLLPFVVPDPDQQRAAPRVLDIGAGSGYLTHIFAELVGDRSGATVVGVDHIDALCALATRNMAKSTSGRAHLASGRVSFVVADGRLGAPAAEAAAGHFDAIHVGASAAALHPALLAQLRAPGRLFIPMDDDGADAQDPDGRRSQNVWTVDKAADGTITRKRLFGVRYVPLTDAPAVGEADND